MNSICVTSDKKVAIQVVIVREIERSRSRLIFSRPLKRANRCSCIRSLEIAAEPGARSPQRELYVTVSSDDFLRFIANYRRRFLAGSTMFPASFLPFHEIGTDGAKHRNRQPPCKSFNRREAFANYERRIMKDEYGQARGL